MSKKKKASTKQTKQNLQKPATKPGKEAAAPKKKASENQVKKEVAAKPEPVQAPKAKESAPAQPKVSKAEPSTARQSAPKAAPAQSKQSNQEAKAELPQAKKKEQAQPSAKGQKGGKPPAKGQKGGKGAKKKSEAADPSVETDAPQVEAVAEVHLPPADPEIVTAEPEVAPAEPESSARAPVVADPGQSESEHKRKLAKTLIDEETDFSPGGKAAENALPSTPQAPADVPRKVAKTMLEVNIGGLKEAAAKATGGDAQSQAKAEVPKSNSEALRDAVEASARAIEEEIAAAIRESEPELESANSPGEATVGEPAAETKAQVPPLRPADRKVAKTMLDFRADELFELANSEIDTLVDAPEEPPAAPTPVPAPTSSPAPQAPAPQPRKVAKTMLEVDVPDSNAILAAAKEVAQEPVARQPIEPEPRAHQPASAEPLEEEPVQKRTPSCDEVSIEDLSEFAQALREDKPMSPPGSRAAKLRKTMLGIRKHGLASSASMAGVSTTSESKQPEIAAEHAPVRVSRSFHPLDNFSFDNLCPADGETSNQSVGEAQADVQVDSQAESVAPEIHDLGDSTEWRAVGDPDSSEKKHTGTVEMAQDPHASPPEGEFEGVSTVWPDDQAQEPEAKPQNVKPERFVPKTMLDMDFLKESLSASVARAEEKLAESIALKSQEPQKQTLTSDDYKVAVPNCPFVWADSGLSKDRVRYCTQCSSQVYDFSGFDMAEAQALIFKRENREGATLYKREDGKFMTNDCPIALKKKKDNALLVGGGVLVLVLLVIMVVVSFITPQPPTATAPSVEAGTPAPSSGGSDVKPSSGSTAKTGTATTAEPPGTFHYKRGKAETPTPAASEPVVVPQTDTTTVPGTTSGYDEGGQFWQYTDKGNN